MNLMRYDTLRAAAPAPARPVREPGPSLWPPGSFRPDADPCHVLMIYQDYALGLQAMALYRQLDQRLARGSSLSHNLLRFDLLQSPAVAPVALGELGWADVVLFAVRTDFTLTAAQQRFLTRALRRGAAKPRALGVLTARSDGAGRGEPPVRPALRAMAQAASMAFFAGTYTPPPPPAGTRPPYASPPRESRPALDPPPRASLRRQPGLAGPRWAGWR